MEEKVNNAGLAAVLSFIFNGLGQLYNGQLAKGLLIIFLSAVGMLVFILGSIFIAFWLMGKIIFAKVLILGLILFCVGLISMCILGIYSILDAYRIATQK
jgi:TM2 domain-containing membrane protein YozV